MNELPVADFTFNNECFNEDIQFTQTASANTSIYHWDFGDGNTSALPSPTHQYATPGDYEVKLLVTTGVGACLDSITKTVTAYPLPEPSFLTADDCVSDVLNFADQSSILPPGTIDIYNWTFGDGNTSTLASPSNMYAAEGVYEVKLILTSNHGCIDSTMQSLTVWPLPVVDFDATTVCESFVSDFTDQSTISSTNSPNSNVVWNWNFGDGNTANTQNTTHTFAAA